MRSETFSREPKASAVCGRRRERFPRASIYNTLCDIEWNTPIGKARACGGDALIRAKAFQQVIGYNPTIIAGEEPEMCVRLRAAGWEIWRIDAEMTLHDAAMTKFSQWWKRALRSGHAYAEGFAMHGAPPESHNAKQVKSIWMWGLFLPALYRARDDRHGLHHAALVLDSFDRIRTLSVARHQDRDVETIAGLDRSDAALYGIFVVLGKFPQLLGMLKYRSSAHEGNEAP